MNYPLRKWFAGLLIAALFCGSALAQGRIATIDLNKAFSNYWKKKEAEANLRDQESDMLKERDSMVQDARKARDAYQKLLNDANDQTLSTDERDKRKRQAEDKYKD